MKSSWTLVAFVPALLAPASALAADSWTSSPLGKSTLLNTASYGAGAPVNLVGTVTGMATGAGPSACPNGKYVVGVEIRSGTLIDAMRVECAKLGPNGEHQDRTQGAWLGNERGGNVRIMRCPAGQVVTASRARAGDFVDQVSFACRRWNAAQGLHGSLSWQPAHGGSGGEPVGPVECPDGMAMTELGGRKAGSYIGFFTVSCKKLPPTQPTAPSTTSAQNSQNQTGSAVGSSPTSAPSAALSISQGVQLSTGRVSQPVAPVLKTLSSKAIAGGNVELTIEGESFAADKITRVEVDGTPVPYRVISPTRVVATVSQHVWTKVNPQSVPIVVTSGGQRISKQLSVR
ncbi:MAG TPA: IPT/TIG domain-containing protein [Steroidobacteraceae bacterium]